ncbi:MAG: hypothetical protein NZZ41_04005 [Candidatus Dojkabacteria bacterium]|nr:hypothetical protein [Candidatus Dojkabacteria bacterium]
MENNKNITKSFENKFKFILEKEEEELFCTIRNFLNEYFKTNSKEKFQNIFKTFFENELEISSEEILKFSYECSSIFSYEVPKNNKNILPFYYQYEKDYDYFHYKVSLFELFSILKSFQCFLHFYYNNIPGWIENLGDIWNIPINYEILLTKEEILKNKKNFYEYKKSENKKILKDLYQSLYEKYKEITKYKNQNDFYPLNKK